MKFHLQIHASEISYLKDAYFFFRKIGRENNMPKKLKEKNDQHLPKSSSYVSILSWYQINEMNSPARAPGGWVVTGGVVVTWLLTSDWWWTG